MERKSNISVWQIGLFEGFDKDIMVMQRDEEEVFDDAIHVFFEREYYDAYVSRPYIIYKDCMIADKIFLLFKAIWEGRNVILVEGRYTRNGMGNNLFAGARSVKRILCPTVNAWDVYDQILSSVLDVAGGEDLICISLGPTATVMAYDLGEKGFQALDIGQLDNEYEWYIRGTQERILIPGKMVAEIKGRHVEKDLYDDEYKAQICKIIGGDGETL